MIKPEHSASEVNIHQLWFTPHWVPQEISKVLILVTPNWHPMWGISSAINLSNIACPSVLCASPHGVFIKKQCPPFPIDRGRKRGEEGERRGVIKHIPVPYCKTFNPVFQEKKGEVESMRLQIRDIDSFVLNWWQIKWEASESQMCKWKRFRPSIFR